MATQRVLNSRRIAYGIAVGLFVFAVWQLNRIDAGGPTHFDVDLGGYEPGTLYLPGPSSFAVFGAPVNRVPGVLLVHALSGDRVSLSSLARRLAENGYVVLAIDALGHGENRNPFPSALGRTDVLYPDVVKGVAFLRSRNEVDGSRIVLMGHSLGALAALDYVQRDSRIEGVVTISAGWFAGWRLDDSQPLRNALFVFASKDPARIRTGSVQIATHLAGVKTLELGKTYGNLDLGTGVCALEIPFNDHVTILFSSEAVRRIVMWLDSITHANRSTPPPLGDSRLPFAALGLATFIVCLVLLARLTGKLAPARHERPTIDAPTGFVVLAGSLALAMPFVSGHPPAAFLSLEDGDVVISWLAIAGILMWPYLILRGNLRPAAIFDSLREASAAGLIAFAGIYVMLVPLGVVIHRLVPTPERLLSAIAAALLLLPFFIVFESLVRRPVTTDSIRFGLAGRTIIVAMLFVGVVIGALPGVAGLLLPILAIEQLLSEVFGVTTYAVCGNIMTIALVDAAWLAWVTAVCMPIRI